MFGSFCIFTVINIYRESHALTEGSSDEGQCDLTGEDP